MHQTVPTSSKQFYFSQAHQDRMGFSLIVALALHVAIILGVGFQSLTEAPASSSLEITLARHQTNQPVDEASYLAQQNQQASGVQEKDALVSVPYESPFNDTQIQEVLPEMLPENTPDNKSAKPSVTTLQSTDAQPAHEESLHPETESTPETIQGPEQINRSQEIATLQAKLDAQRQAYAKRPRIHRLTSVATKKSADAQYLYQWTKRIETIGNQNYPEDARAKHLFGELRLLVAIRADGRVETIKILRSSGYKLLDDAAIHIVRLSEPFAPFPPHLRQDTDLLEIIRTWQFRRNRFSSEN